MQEVLYFFVCSSSSLISSMFHSVSPGPLLGQIKAEQSPFAELGILVVPENAVEQRGGKGSCSRVWALHSSQIRAGKTWGYCRKGAPSLQHHSAPCPLSLHLKSAISPDFLHLLPVSAHQFTPNWV